MHWALSHCAAQCSGEPNGSDSGRTARLSRSIESMIGRNSFLGFLLIGQDRQPVDNIFTGEGTWHNEGYILEGLLSQASGGAVVGTDGIMTETKASCLEVPQFLLCMHPSSIPFFSSVLLLPFSLFLSLGFVFSNCWCPQRLPAPIQRVLQETVLRRQFLFLENRLLCRGPAGQGSCAMQGGYVGITMSQVVSVIMCAQNVFRLSY